MALKDQLNDALVAVAPDDTRRQETLRAALDAAGGGSDAEIQAAIARIISEREQKAASFSTAGQTELAKTERGEIDALRAFLRMAGGTAPPPPKKTSAAGPASLPEAPKPLFSRTQMVFGGIAIAILVAIVIILLRTSGDSNTDLSTAGTGGKITVFKDDRTMGDPKAPVVFLEYAAPTCPHCAHFAITAMPEIKKKYIDTGKVFYIFRNFPLQATDGAVEGLARCLPADKYFSFLDLMFRNQSKWDPDSLNPPPDVGAALIQMARIVGMSPEKAKQCMEDRQTQDRVNQVAQDGELKYQIRATPTFIINGEVVQIPLGSVPGDVVKQRIEALLSKK
jgi:protein-disulfide isomerase